MGDQVKHRSYKTQIFFTIGVCQMKSMNFSQALENLKKSQGGLDGVFQRFSCLGFAQTCCIHMNLTEKLASTTADSVMYHKEMESLLKILPKNYDAVENTLLIRHKSNAYESFARYAQSTSYNAFTSKIMLSLMSSKQRRPKYVRKNLQELMEPRPQWDRLKRGLLFCPILSDVPLFLNNLSTFQNWNAFPFASKKKIKKEWRLLKIPN